MPEPRPLLSDSPPSAAVDALSGALSRFRRARRDLFRIERAPARDTGAGLAHEVTLSLSTLPSAVVARLQEHRRLGPESVELRMFGHVPRDTCISERRRLWFHVTQPFAVFLARLGVQRLEEPAASVRPRAAPGTRAHFELETAIDLIEAVQGTRGITANDGATAAALVKLPPRGNVGRIAVATSNTPVSATDPKRPLAARAAPGLVLLKIALPWLRAGEHEVKLTPEQAEGYADALREMAAKARSERDGKE